MKRKTNNLNKNTSIIVKFYPATDKEINKLLKTLNVTGTKVSNLIPRWAIDVPFWKENYYSEKLASSELVERVYKNPTIKKFSREIEEDFEEGEDE